MSLSKERYINGTNTTHDYVAVQPTLKDQVVQIKKIPADILIEFGFYLSLLRPSETLYGTTIVNKCTEFLTRSINSINNNNNNHFGKKKNFIYCQASKKVTRKKLLINLKLLS